MVNITEPEEKPDEAVIKPKEIKEEEAKPTVEATPEAAEEKTEDESEAGPSEEPKRKVGLLIINFRY